MQDIIVIGASAGGVEALQVLVSELPPDLPAALFITIHIPAVLKSELPNILKRAGRLPAIHPSANETIEPGVIYIAPPDRHMLVEGDRVSLWKGPRENRHRPAINPLFRSAAMCCGARVAGVVMTGTLDDGSAGLWLIKRNGGVTIVQQDPLFPEMVRNACEYVEIDYEVTLSLMGSLLTTLARGPIPRPGQETSKPVVRS